MKTMLKLLIVAGFVGGLAVQSAVAGERDGGVSGVSGASVEKSSQMSKKPEFSGDIRDCLYAKYGSNGKDWKKASYSSVNRTLRKCGFCGYGKTDT